MQIVQIKYNKNNEFVAGIPFLFSDQEIADKIHEAFERIMAKEEMQGDFELEWEQHPVEVIVDETDFILALVHLATTSGRTTLLSGTACLGKPVDLDARFPIPLNDWLGCIVSILRLSPGRAVRYLLLDDLRHFGGNQR